MQDKEEKQVLHWKLMYEYVLMVIRHTVKRIIEAEHMMSSEHQPISSLQFYRFTHSATIHVAEGIKTGREGHNSWQAVQRNVQYSK